MKRKSYFIIHRKFNKVHTKLYYFIEQNYNDDFELPKYF